MGSWMSICILVSSGDGWASGVWAFCGTVEVSMALTVVA